MVSAVNNQIAGTATRALAQADWRAAMTSTGTAAQYDAPRNAPVRGRTIVHAKNMAVCSVKNVSWRPARNTSALAAYRSHRIGTINGRTPGGASNVEMPGPHAGTAGAIRTMLQARVARILSHTFRLPRIESRSELCPGNSFKEFKYIAIYRNRRWKLPARNQSPVNSRSASRGWAR